MPAGLSRRLQGQGSIIPKSRPLKGHLVHGGIGNKAYARMLVQRAKGRESLALSHYGTLTHRVQDSCWVKNAVSIRVLAKLRLFGITIMDW